MTDKKVILITGCSSGFGLISAAYLAQKGHNVIATMRNMEKKSALINELKKRRATLEIKQLDVTNTDSIEKTFRAIAEEYGNLDVLINNAGYGIGGAFEDLSEEEIREQMETNFFGAQNVTRAAIPLIRPKKSGKIINISSVSGIYALPHFGAYNCSKWALEAFSESLRYELKPFGIDVLIIEPGTYRTEIFERNARYAKRYYDKNSPYYERSQHLHKLVMERVKDTHKDLEEIPMLIEKLIKSKRPPFRTQPDIEAKTMAFFRKILPFSVFFWLINAGLFSGLKNPKK